MLAAAWAQAAYRPRPPKAPLQETAYVDSSLYVLKISSYRKRVSDGNTRGGAVAPHGDGYLLAAGDGWLYSVAQDPASGTLRVEKLRHRVPYNPEEFNAGGRKIFGGLVPFGEVWRTGANAATTLTVSAPVELGGRPLENVVDPTRGY